MESPTDGDGVPVEKGDAAELSHHLSPSRNSFPPCSMQSPKEVLVAHSPQLAHATVNRTYDVRGFRAHPAQVTGAHSNSGKDVTV